MKIKFLCLAILLTTVSLGYRAFWTELSAFVVTETRVDLPRWPSECNGLKIVLLADLHVGSPRNGIENLVKVVAATNALHPDLILLAGDYVIHEVVGGHFVRPEPIIRVLSGLKAKSGVYAVLGNHDWWFSASRMRTAFAGANIPLLENKSVPIRLGECRFWLAGIGDFWMGRHDFYKAARDIPPTSPAIAFTHNPDLFYEIPSNISITFAGHTHGGQVHLPWLGRLIVPSRYGEKFAAGLITEAGRVMYVTTGVGTSILPVRFRVPPEIAVITLRKG